MADTIEWPAHYVYPDTGEHHDWDETAEDEGYGDSEPYTYRDLVTDQAGAQGISVEEFLDEQDEDEDDPWGDEDI